MARQRHSGGLRPRRTLLDEAPDEPDAARLRGSTAPGLGRMANAHVKRTAKQDAAHVKAACTSPAAAMQASASKLLFGYHLAAELVDRFRGSGRQMSNGGVSVRRQWP